MMTVWGSLGTATLALAYSGAAAAETDPALDESFEQAVIERVEFYEATRTDDVGIRSAYDGGLLASHDRLEALVPDKVKTAIDHFVLGNMLYRIAPARSMAHHLEAYARFPHEPVVLLEMALQYHRAGDCERAIPLYEELVEEGFLAPAQYALLAHCLIEVGRPRQALKAWGAADHAAHHTGIDFAIHSVFGDDSPFAIHDRLVRRVKSGDREAVVELLLNALAWRRDWWNQQINGEAIAATIAIVEEAFGAESSIAKEVALFARSRELDADGFRALLVREGLIIAGGRLPRSGAIADQLVRRALRLHLIDIEELSERFLDELIERARPPGRDRGALKLVAGLLVAEGRIEELQEFDLLGWHTYREPDFAYSYFVGRREASPSDLRHDDPELLAAVAEFPDDPRFPLLSLVLARQAGVETTGHLERLIDAEFHGLRSDPERYSYALKRYFAELAGILSNPLPAAAGPAPDSLLNVVK